MSLESDYIRTLKRRSDWLAKISAAGTLTPKGQAELRALNWAIDTVRWSVDQAAQSAGRFRERKTQEFEERRQERRAKQLLRELRDSVTELRSPSLLHKVDQYLRAKEKQA